MKECEGGGLRVLHLYSTIPCSCMVVGVGLARWPRWPCRDDGDGLRPSVEGVAGSVRDRDTHARAV